MVDRKRDREVPQSLARALFSPGAIAVIGASRSPGKVGHEVLRNLINSRFPGFLYPVNPKADEILGLRTYPDVESLPGPVDLAVVVVPAPAVVDAVASLGKRGNKVAVVISSGFKETGVAGAQLERDLRETARQVGIRVIGPNCLGVLDTHTPYNASFAADMPSCGGLGLFSQSGALCTAILDWAVSRGIGFSRVISYGNRADINETDLLSLLADDLHTNVILGYLEGVADGMAFLKKASAVTPNKPVILIKAGGTAAGAKAAASHTGTLAGSDQTFEAVCRKAGILRARSVDELFRYARAFEVYPPPSGNRVAIITNAGGPGIMAADAIERSELRLASLRKETVNRLRKNLPPAAAFHNPVDIVGDARSNRYAAALQSVVKDPQVDAVCVILTPQAMTDTETIAEKMVGTASGTKKPILAVFMGDAGVQKGVRVLTKSGIPNYCFPEEAVQALEALFRYRKQVGKKEQKPWLPSGDRAAAARIIRSARREGRSLLLSEAASSLLSAYKIPTPLSLSAVTAAEAISAAEKIGYPVVLKIDSPAILHKTDLGGVIVDIGSPAEIRTAFQAIMASVRQQAPQAPVSGVIVQKQALPGREVVIGAVRDPQFGPLVMFGLGGIYVEILKDISFALAPLARDEIWSLIRSIRAYPLLEGARGKAPADIDFLAEILARFCSLVTDFPEIVEADINPVVVYDTGKKGIVVDARFTVEGDEK